MAKSCFVISPLGKENSATRKKANELFHKVFEPLCNKHNYQIDRADKLKISGVITNQILRYLRDADLVIADLTGNNPNVYYELAIRHAVRKPVICLMNENQKIPFDIAAVKVIKYLSLDDDDHIKRLIDSLDSEIKSIREFPDLIEYPLSTVFHDSSLVATDDPYSYIIHEMYNQTNDIKSSFHEFKKTLFETLQKEGNIEAEFLDGQEKAFGALTQATLNAKNTVRSSRFFPESVLSQNDYVNAIHGRVTGTDGKTPLKKYLRIIALNNMEKIHDVNHHIMNFAGKPFVLYLSKVSNAFELVVIDDTDAFIHFYRKERVINSTLHIMERSVVWEFKKIYDEFLQRIDPENIFDCKEINTDNIGEYLKKAKKIFASIDTTQVLEER